jgi:redox-sensitive bicupin YhaK (pirin superfamily)
MSNAFVLRSDERGYDRILSTGPTASYVGGHPDAFITRFSSFNFGNYQDGRHGFGKIRVFGDEAFYHPGCSYNMHPHHNFIICAFVLEGQLTHINTLGGMEDLHPGDYYAFSAGSGGLHEELNRGAETMRAIYLWLLPDRLLLPPSYQRGHFDPAVGLNRITPLIGDQPGAIPIHQDARVSRLVTDRPGTYRYKPRSSRHGVYAFVLDGSVACAGTTLKRRDSAGIRDAEEIACETGRGDTDILFVETIM